MGLSWLLHIPLGLLFSLSPAKVHSSTLFIVVAYQPSDYTPSFMADLDLPYSLPLLLPIIEDFQIVVSKMSEHYMPQGAFVIEKS